MILLVLLMMHSNMRELQTKLRHKEIKIDADSLSLLQFLKCVISMIANITIENKVKPKPTSGSLPWDCFRYRANNIKEAMLPFTGVEVDLGNFTSEDNLEVSSTLLLLYLLKYSWDCHGIFWAKRPCGLACWQKGSQPTTLI